MQSDDAKDEPKQSETISPQQREAKPVFSEKEVKTIVKDFVAAYISGQVKIVFPSAQDIVDHNKLAGKKASYGKASDVELSIKTDFNKHVRICAGTLEATPEEQEKAIDGLFSDLIDFRSSDRIIGTFTEYALDARIRKLEEGIDKVNNLVEEIVEWLMRGVVDE